MVAHAEESFPSECCGVLLGIAAASGDREVVRVLRGRNIHPENPERRFDLHPADLLAADDWARENGCQILGFYHSHPDRPAVPSEIDRQWAGPWGDAYSHVILSVRSRRHLASRSWVLREGVFGEQSVEIVSA